MGQQTEISFGFTSKKKLSKKVSKGRLLQLDGPVF
jgi:hypothetical protein